MRKSQRILRDGVVAGLLGAGAVAAWFLIFDIGRARPFETPAALAAVLFHGESGTTLPLITWSLVVQYSVAHVAAFVLFGVAAAGLVAAADREHGLTTALLVFFGAFEVFFIALVLLHGPALATIVAWWSILAGNLLATAVMLSYLFYGNRALGAALAGPWVAVVREGVVGGIVGAATVALWFILYDTAMSRPLYTPALLGAALLKGLRDPSLLQISTDVVLGYIVLHAFAFIFLGVIAAVLLTLAEREPMLLLAVFVLFTCFEVFFFGVSTLLDEALVESLGWWTIFIANILATTTMLGYFLPRHRYLRSRLVERWQNQE